MMRWHWIKGSKNGQLLMLKAWLLNRMDERLEKRKDDELRCDAKLLRLEAETANLRHDPVKLIQEFPIQLIV